MKKDRSGDLGRKEKPLNQKPKTPIKKGVGKKSPTPWIFLVAGAGFEPTTFGL
jgi:hypothetical protein